MQKAKPVASTKVVPKGKPEHFPTVKSTSAFFSLSIRVTSDRQRQLKKASPRADYPAVLPDGSARLQPRTTARKAIKQ